MRLLLSTVNRTVRVRRRQKEGDAAMAVARTADERQRGRELAQRLQTTARPRREPARAPRRSPYTTESLPAVAVRRRLIRAPALCSM